MFMCRIHHLRSEDGTKQLLLTGLFKLFVVHKAVISPPSYSRHQALLEFAITFIETCAYEKIICFLVVCFFEGVIQDEFGVERLTKFFIFISHTYQGAVIPGPPFLFGACIVLMSFLVALFIPEYSKGSGTQKHSNSKNKF